MQFRRCVFDFGCIRPLYLYLAGNKCVLQVYGGIRVTPRGVHLSLVLLGILLNLTNYLQFCITNSIDPNTARMQKPKMHDIHAETCTDMLRQAGRQAHASVHMHEHSPAYHFHINLPINNAKGSA